MNLQLMNLKFIHYNSHYKCISWNLMNLQIDEFKIDVFSFSKDFMTYLYNTANTFRTILMEL